MASRRLEVVIAGSANDAVRALGQTESAVGRFDRSSGRAASNFSRTWRTGISNVGRSIGGLVAGAGLALFFSSAVTEAQEARTVMRQTAAVIQSTGGVAGITADHLANLSGRLSDLAAVDDEVIQQGGNVLLTFRNVRAEGGIFDDALASALDMKAALGMELQPAVMAVGKALNDPIAGISRLTRMGVTFTDQQKDQIAAMMLFGDTAGAQRIILEELATEFGGAAEANKTSAMEFQVAMDNIKESVGNILLPAMGLAAGAMTWAADWFDGLDSHTQTAVAALGTVAVGALIMWAAIGGPAAAAVLAIGGVAATIWLLLGPERVKDLQKWWQGFLDDLPQRWKAVVKYIQPVTDAIRDASDMAKDFVKSLDWKGIGDAFGQLGNSIQQVKDQLGITSTNGQIAMQVLAVGVYLVFGGMMIMIGAIHAAIGAFAKLGAVSLAGVAWSIAWVKGLLGAAKEAASSLWSWLQKVASVKVSIPGLDSIVSALKSAWSYASNLWGELSNLVNRTLHVSVQVDTPVGTVGFARGTDSAPPGLHWVGENGPELMAFRGGEKVIPHRQSMALAAAAGSGGDVVVNTTVMLDGKAVGRSTTRHQRADARSYAGADGGSY